MYVLKHERTSSSLEAIASRWGRYSLHFTRKFNSICQKLCHIEELRLFNIEDKEERIPVSPDGVWNLVFGCSMAPTTIEELPENREGAGTTPILTAGSPTKPGWPV